MLKTAGNSNRIDWYQYKTLFLTQLAIELRENRGIGSRSTSKIPPLVSSLIFYAGMGLILAANLVDKTNAFMYSMLNLAYSMVMCSFSIIIEFGNSILNPDDRDVLTHRPINSRTYFVAKLSNLLFYIVLITAAMCLLPGFLGIGIKGNNLVFPFIYLITAFFANTASASFIILIYTLLLKKINYQKFKDIIAYFQIIFSLFLFLFYQFIPRLNTEMFVNGEKSLQIWLYLIPPAWFAGLLQMVSSHTVSFNSQLGLIAICCTCMIILFAFRKISLQYAGLIADLNTASLSESSRKTDKSKLKDKNIIQNLFRSLLKDQESVAGFDVTSAMCKKDRSLKMTIYPLLGIPLALLGLAIFEHQLKDPLIHGLFPGQGITLFIIFMFTIMYSLTMLMKYSHDWEASWIFYLAPLKSPGKFYQGVKLALFTRYVLPFFLLLAIIYTFYIPITHTLHFLISLFLFCLFLNTLVSFRIKTLPFSEKRKKGERIRRFSFIVFVGPLFGLFALLYTYVFKNFIYWIIGQIVILSLWKLLEHLSVKIIDKNLKTIHPS